MLWINITLWLMLLGGNLLEILFLYNLCSFLNFPISEKYFGANKKWRGLITLPLGSSIIMYIITQGSKYYYKRIYSEISNLPIITAPLIGFVFNLAELPNSYIKRKYKIKPGEYNKYTFIADHVDSIFFATITAYYCGIPFESFILNIYLGPFIHMTNTIFIRPLYNRILK